MKNRPLKVGLDLDGVILYNPARIGRPLVTFAKKYILGQKKKKFTVPKGAIEKKVWAWLHKTSIFQAAGMDEIKSLTEKGLIEPYIITARFSYLKDDIESWLKKIGAQKFIKEWYYNKNDEQPHLYKENMLNKLGIDIYIEDNWDIVTHLNQTSVKKKPDLKVLWIYNIFDRVIPYQYKFPSLKKAVEKVQTLANQYD